MGFMQFGSRTQIHLHFVFPANLLYAQKLYNVFDFFSFLNYCSLFKEGTTDTQKRTVKMEEEKSK